MKKIICLVFILIITLNTNSQLYQQWVARYNGIVSTNYDQNPVAVTTDYYGNIYIAAYRFSILSNLDYYILKYNSSGIKLWDVSYNSFYNLNDKAVAIALDNTGSVYVTGISENSGGYQSDDFLTIKINSNGDTLWTRRHNGEGNYIDQPVSIEVFNNSIVVCGVSRGPAPSNFGYCLIKYDLNGSKLWETNYTIPNGRYDKPTSFKIDNLGCICVTGYSDSSQSGQYCYLTVKFNAFGQFIWKNKYSGPARRDFPYCLDVDNSSNVYVTGTSAFTYYDNTDYATVKYDSSGNQLWAARYNGFGNSMDYAKSIKVDLSGSVYVTGHATGTNSALDITTIKYNSAGVQQWIKIYDSSENDSDMAYMLKLDNLNNIYVTGCTKSITDYFDFITIKYNNSGNMEWNRTYNGSGDSTDISRALTIDNNSNIIITGESRGFETDLDVEVIKYNNSGSTLWEVRQFPAQTFPSDDMCNSSCIDSNLNIYVTGRSQDTNNNYDYLTVKYNPYGVLLWSSRVNGTGNNYDEAKLIGSDISGNIIVTGKSYGLNTHQDIFTIKYSPTGAILWTSRYNSTYNLDDVPNSMKIDNQGNIFVTGYSMRSNAQPNICEYITIKYDPSGNLLWSASFSANTHNDHSNDVEIDDSGNVYVTGMSWAANPDFYTIKYDQNGTQIWAQRFDNSYSEEAMKIALDDSLNVYITGLSDIYIYPPGWWVTITITAKYNKYGVLQWNKTYAGQVFSYYAPKDILSVNGNIYVTGYGYPGYPSITNYFLIKYDRLGNQNWGLQYNGTGNANDDAYALASDSTGKIYVTGGSTGINTGYDFETVIYDSLGNFVYDARYNGPRDSTDIANSILIDRHGSVYVSGTSLGYGTGNDFALIKYNSFPIGLHQMGSEYPGAFSLHQNYPNPFNPTTKIRFDIPLSPRGEGQGVRLVIYDMLGREVTTLVNEQLSPGTYEVEWDGSNFASGVYFYSLIVSDASAPLSIKFTQTRKLILLK